MKIYLSGYWNKNCIFSAIIICIIPILVIAFCMWNPDAEDFLFIVCSLLFEFLLCYLVFISTKLVRYVINDNQQLVMCSFYGKKMCFINLEADIYYEVLPLIEGSYSKREFIVISNKSFTSYQSNGFTQLAKICKLIDKHGSQIIMPYKDTDTLHCFSRSEWHKIN